MPIVYAIEMFLVICFLWRISSNLNRLGEDLYRSRGGDPEADKIDAEGQPAQVPLD